MIAKSLHLSLVVLHLFHIKSLNTFIQYNNKCIYNTTNYVVFCNCSIFTPSWPAFNTKKKERKNELLVEAALFNNSNPPPPAPLPWIGISNNLRVIHCILLVMKVCNSFLLFNYVSNFLIVFLFVTFDLLVYLVLDGHFCPNFL